MEPEGSLPHSKASTTCPYPVPAQSKLQYMIQYKIIKLYIVSKYLHFSLPLYVASFEIKCLMCSRYAMDL